MRCLMCDQPAGSKTRCAPCADLMRRAEQVAYPIATEVSSLVSRHKRNPDGDLFGAEWVIDQIVEAMRRLDPLEQQIRQRVMAGQESRRKRLPLRRCACCGVQFASLLSGRDYCEACESDDVDEHQLADNLERLRDFRAEEAADRVARGAA